MAVAASSGDGQAFPILLEQNLLSEEDMEFSAQDRLILRDLAAEVTALAARPIEADKRDLWRRHNALEPTRPLIFCDPEDGWIEIIPPETLKCDGAVAQDWELRLRKEIFYGTQMLDDYTIRPFFDVAHVHTLPDWGLHETQIGGENRGSTRWESPVRNETDLERLHFPQIRIDYRATRLLEAAARDIFGNLLSVRVKTSWWWSVGMTKTLVYLRGLEQTMFDMSDNPGIVHSLMAILRDGNLAMIDALEQNGLLYPNWEGSYVGSGGLGWTDQLPQEDYQGRTRLKDLWGNSESQETVGISPRMFAEFIFPYQLALVERFGLNCYGCCEPLDSRWHIVRQFPNLRRVSVSPWSNREKMAANLEDRYILSMKPNPADLAVDTFDEERIRSILRRDLDLTRGCRVEIIMKDNHTIRHDPTRLTRFIQIAREEAEKT
ncbi:MAG: hypothetical protein M1281_19365 [Chloroflexi bacterium]|nr:hypothetical protein [Chloroflexota bacterium]